MALFLPLTFAILAAVVSIFTGRRVGFAIVVSRTGVLLRISKWKLKYRRIVTYDTILRSVIDPRESKKKKRRVHLQDLKGAFRLIEVDLRGRLGIRDDAAATAILCGAANCFVETALSVFCAGAKASVGVTPDFTKGVFWLYLEGILMIYPGKVIVTLIRLWLKEVRKKWRIPSKTSWKRQWQGSRKWSM